MADTTLNTIRQSQSRDDIRVTLPGAVIYGASLGTTVGQLLQADQSQNPTNYDSPIMGGIVNGKLRELAYPVMGDATLAPVLLSSSDGGRIYRRSLVLLLTTAVDELFPGVKVGVRYAVPEGGFYCVLRNREPFSADELVRLSSHMRAIIDADEPIHKQLVPLDEALKIFEARKADDKLRLLAQRDRDELVLYRLRQRTDYYYGYMLPSTGALNAFHLVHARQGFILQYPRSNHPKAIQTVNPDSKLTAVFREADEWLGLMGVEDMGRLNTIVQDRRAQELILVAEALHEQRVAYIAGEICERHKSDGVRIVLIAGPSSSGKTTFSKRLAIQLLAHGITPFTLELDNYFVDRELTPRDSDGEYDFEALGALNIDLFNEHLIQLTRGDEVTLPKFNFITGKREEGRTVTIDPNCVVIIEGIHGLNPNLVPQISPETIHRVYVSALTQLNVDAHNRVPTTDVRLLRRIVRDARNRGYSATDTLQRWPSVRRGEKRNIFPYQENADIMFNSALVYELAALRPFAEPLLLQVAQNTPPHIEANRLLSFLRWVHPLDTIQLETIPDTSLLREFIGGSSLDNYHPRRLGK
ncbi:MAG: nucleoside kinase [Chloroflexota bacterium]